MFLGRLGLGDCETRSAPCAVTLPEQVEPQSVHCGSDCSMILTKNNMLLACGSNVHNRLVVPCNIKPITFLIQINLFCLLIFC